MKEYMLRLVALFLVVGCATQRSPDEIAAQEEANRKMLAAAALVKVTKADPEGCEYISAVEAIHHGWNLEPGTYDGAIQVLRKMAVSKQANAAVIDDMKRPSTLSATGTTQAYFHFNIYGRLFRCP